MSSLRQIVRGTWNIRISVHLLHYLQESVILPSTSFTLTNGPLWDPEPIAKYETQPSCTLSKLILLLYFLPNCFHYRWFLFLFSSFFSPPLLFPHPLSLLPPLWHLLNSGISTPLTPPLAFYWTELFASNFFFRLNGPSFEPSSGQNHLIVSSWSPVSLFWQSHNPESFHRSIFSEPTSKLLNTSGHNHTATVVSKIYVL